MKSFIKNIVPEKKRIGLRLLWAKITAVFYMGNRRSCNCCGFTFRRFRSFGHPNRPDVRCPYCLSLERTRLLKFYLTEKVFTGDRAKDVLHIAPEPALVSFIKRKAQRYITGDINIQRADHFVDITDISFEAETFDLIICSHVLAHLPREEKAINEMVRVLKPGGEVILVTRIYPNTNTLELTIDESRNHGDNDPVYRQHGADFLAGIQRPGCTANRLDYRAGLSSEIIERFRLGNSSSELFFIIKKNENGQRTE